MVILELALKMLFPYFRNVRFVRVSFLGGRYFYNICIVKSLKFKDYTIFPC